VLKDQRDESNWKNCEELSGSLDMSKQNSLSQSSGGIQAGLSGGKPWPRLPGLRGPGWPDL
jgi:hypothetical protein